MKLHILQEQIAKLYTEIYDIVKEKGYVMIQASECDIETTTELGTLIKLSVQYEYQNPETGKKLLGFKQRIV